MGGLGAMFPSGVSKERVTHWSGVSGAEGQPTGSRGGALTGFQGSALNPSEEPTTTGAQPVVIVGY